MAETEIKSINEKTIADVSARNNKLDKNQGAENAGKILGIGADGNVVPQKPVQALAGAAAPTTATSGVVGQEYYVIADGAVTEMYVCTAVANGTYTWDKVEFGGACMDVTGAKVGQIAKITAVDSAGKPTAWEPVDMPSDEEEFIQTIPMSSDVGEYALADLTVYKKVRFIITKTYKNIGTGNTFIVVDRQGFTSQYFFTGPDFVKYAFAEGVYEENGNTYTATIYYTNHELGMGYMQRAISRKRDTEHENQSLKLSIPVSYLEGLPENAHIDVYGVKR